MLLFYCVLTCLLLIAISLLALPFLRTNKSILSKNFLMLATFIFLLTGILYWFTGNYRGLHFWLTEGKEHYQLQVTLERLGGLDGVIEKIKLRLNQHPEDKKGWVILSKLYSAKHQEKLAREAMARANNV